MSWESWALWGFVATLILTAITSAAQGLGLTRMSVPYMLGALLVRNRDRAKAVGFVVHLLNGWLFSLIYVAAFEAWGGATWWRGLVIGLAHAFFVLTAGMHFLPGIHPRMASEQQGPTVARVLEPPGFLGLHYGVQTPIVIAVSHAVFGIVLGAFYAMSAEGTLRP